MPAPLLLALLLAGPVTLARPREVRTKFDGFARIAAPATLATRRINAALTRWERRAVAEADGCIHNGGPMPGSWERTVATTMRGPEFLSYLVTDDYYCGGAHPDVAHASIVYDLATGAPVEWRALLGSTLAGELALTSSGDGVNVVTLASSRLTALYRRGYRSGQDDASVDGDCRGVVNADGDLENAPAAEPMLAWLDGRAGGLVLQYDLSHAVQVCSVPVVIAAETLRREGASARLVDALLAARRLARR